MATFVIRNVPDDLHRAVRRAAVDNDESIKAFVLRALEHELERHEREGRR